MVVETETSGGGESIAALQAVELLLSSPRDGKLYRFLHRTYLQPALTQEKAAEVLNLLLVPITAISKPDDEGGRYFMAMGN